MLNLKLAIISLCLGFIFYAGLNSPVEAATCTMAQLQACIEDGCQEGYNACVAKDKNKIYQTACALGLNTCQTWCTKNCK